MTDIQYILNSFLLLFCGSLVMFMACGFSMLEAGLVRSKNVTAILTKNICLYSLSCLTFFAIGYQIMYGAISDGDHAGAADFFFQVVFVATAASIISGVIAERMKFWSFMGFIVVLSAIIYPLQGNWTWGGGFLSEMGFSDFAGSTIVHSVGGWAALAGVLLLGARTGKYGNDGKVNLIPPSNLPLATLGTFILWLGWFGFNGGSQLAMATKVDVNAISAVFTNTNIAAAAGAMTAAVFTQLFYKKVDLTMVLNGALAGLVSITAGPDYPTMGLAIIIGTIGSGLTVIAIPLFDKIKIDDPVGALSVHLVAGIWGTLAVGIFKPEVSLLTQLWGVGIIGAFVFVTSFAVWYGIKLIVGLRISVEEEMSGVDIVEFGHPAYTIGRGEFVTHEEIHKKIKGYLATT
jgi:Amt family ammonium transporter